MTDYRTAYETLAAAAREAQKQWDKHVEACGRSQGRACYLNDMDDAMLAIERALDRQPAAAERAHEHIGAGGGDEDGYEHPDATIVSQRNALEVMTAASIALEQRLATLETAAQKLVHAIRQPEEYADPTDEVEERLNDLEHVLSLFPSCKQARSQYPSPADTGAAVLAQCCLAQLDRMATLETAARAVVEQWLSDTTPSGWRIWELMPALERALERENG